MMDTDEQDKGDRFEIEKPWLEKGLLVRAGWESFRQMVAHDVSEEMCDSMNISFHAGVMHILGILKTIGQPAMPVKDGSAILHLIEAEISRYKIAITPVNKSKNN